MTQRTKSPLDVRAVRLLLPASMAVTTKGHMLKTRRHMDTARADTLRSRVTDNLTTASKVMDNCMEVTVNHLQGTLLMDNLNQVDIRHSNLDMGRRLLPRPDIERDDKHHVLAC